MECNTLSYLFLEHKIHKLTIWCLVREKLCEDSLKNSFSWNFEGGMGMGKLAKLLYVSFYCINIRPPLRYRLHLRHNILFSSCIITKFSRLHLTSVPFAISFHYLGSLGLYSGFTNENSIKNIFGTDIYGIREHILNLVDVFKQNLYLKFKF